MGKSGIYVFFFYLCNLKRDNECTKIHSRRACWGRRVKLLNKTMKNRCADDTPREEVFYTHTHTYTQKRQTKCDLCVSEKRTFHAHSNSGTAAAAAAGWAMLRIKWVPSNNKNPLFHTFSPTILPGSLYCERNGRKIVIKNTRILPLLYQKRGIKFRPFPLALTVVV